MAGRIRTIKPELLEDAKAAALDDHSWRLFVSSLLLCDDYGCFRIQSIKQLDGAVFWATDCPPMQTMQSVERLSRESLWTLYMVVEQRYARVTNWERHQKVDHPGLPRIPHQNHKAAIVFTDVALFFSRESRETLDPDRYQRPATSDQRPATTTVQRALHVAVGDAALQADQTDADPKPMALALVEPDVTDWREDAIQAAYERYPRKRERGAGHRRFRSQLKTRADGQALLQAATNYARTVSGREPDKIKLWPTFASVWRDYIDVPAERQLAATKPTTEQLLELADALEEEDRGSGGT